MGVEPNLRNSEQGWEEIPSVTTITIGTAQEVRVNRRSIYLQGSYAEEYDDENFGNAFGRRLREDEVALYVSMMETSREILDVGAGTGKLSLPIIVQGRHVISLDASVEMLRIARKHADRNGVALESVVCDAQQLCFADNAFDCVVSSRTLMHVADWRKAVAELCRASRYMVVMDFPPVVSLAGLGYLLRRLRNLFSARAQNYRLFSTAGVVRELERNNFKVVELKKDLFFPIFFHRWLDRPSLSARVEGLCKTLGLNRLLGAPITLKALKCNTKARALGSTPSSGPYVRSDSTRTDLENRAAEPGIE